MIYSPIENQVSKQVSFPDVRPKVTHEKFTYSNSWTGSLYHYYQDFVLSEQFDLSTVLIEPKQQGNAFAGSNFYSFEIIDDAGGTIVRVWTRYNDKEEPSDLIIEITQGLSYVQYAEIDETLANSTSTESAPVSTVPDWSDDDIHITILTSGLTAYKGKTGSGTSYYGAWQFELTSATTMGFKAFAPAASNCTFQVAIWRY